MNEVDQVASHDKYAENYDSQVKEYHSHGHDVLFGMLFEYVKTGENLLDLGIGTGLSSINFSNFGLNVTGIDGSAGMLEECRKKKFAKELKQYDIQDLPLPYESESFSHVICCGVFHFFGEILPIINDAFRILKPGGILGFTIASPTIVEKKTFSDIIPDHISSPTAWGVPIYKHSDNFINSIAKQLDLKILKQQKLMVKGGKDESDDILFKAIVMRKE